MEKETCELTKPWGKGRDWNEECGECHIGQCMPPPGRQGGLAGTWVLVRAKPVEVGQSQILRASRVPTIL